MAPVGKTRMAPWKKLENLLNAEGMVTWSNAANRLSKSRNEICNMQIFGDINKRCFYEMVRI